MSKAISVKTKKKRGRPRLYAFHTERFPEYGIWKAIKQRCYNPKHVSYRWYGGEGISMCPEWQKDFMAFYNHIGPRPSKSHSVDRIDSSRGYEPGNVRWATRDVQMNNCRANVPVTFRGISLNISQWAHRLGMSPGVLRYRINAGWPLEKAFSTPARSYKSKHKAQEAA